MKKMRFSSSRTVIFQIALIIAGLLSLYLLVQNAFIFEKLEIVQKVFTLLYLLLGIAFIIIATKMYDLNAYKNEIQFSSVFGKKVEVEINDIKIYDISSFSFTLIDPLRQNRITQIKCNHKGKEDWFLILNPTNISKSLDIETLITEIKNKHGQVPAEKKVSMTAQ